MTDITTHIKTILQQQGNANAHDGEYEIVCECDASRKKQGEKKLKVWVQADGMCSWNCTHCGEKGGSPIFRNGDTAPSEKTKPKEPEYELPREIKYDKWTADAVAFMKSRGFTADTISAMGVFFCNNFAFGKEGDAWITPPAIVFPYYENDVIVNYKIRAIDKKDFRQAKGVNKKPCRPTLYNIDRVYNGWGEKKEIIICEGEFDVMAFFEAGFPNAVSNPIGASGDAKKQTQEQIKKANESKALIYANYLYLKNADRIIFAGDNDAVGKGLQGAIADVLGRENCYYVDWGEYKDANDVLMAHGKEGIISIMDNIKPLPIAKEQKPKEAVAKEKKPKKTDDKEYNEKTPKRVIVKDSFFDENPDLCIIQAPRDNDPSGYVEWRGGAWHFLTKTDVKDRIAKVSQSVGADVNKLRTLVDEVFATINTELRGRDTRSNTDDWNRFLRSIPLDDGYKSVCLNKGLVIDTPRIDKNYEFLPIKANELEKGISNIKNGDSKWLVMLNDWFPDDADKIRFLQIALGQALIGNPAQIALLLTGAGGDGKSVFVGFLRRVFGKPFWDTTPPEVFLKIGNTPMKDNAKLGLKHARFACVPEIDDPFASWRSGPLKDISGGDTSSVRALYKENSEITPRVLPIIVGNHLPRSSDAGIGMRRRLKVLHFLTSQMERDDRILKHEEDELIEAIKGDIVAWVLIGLRDWHVDYKRTPTMLHVSQKVVEESEDYFAGEDEFAHFFNKFAIKKPSASITREEFIHRFRSEEPKVALRLKVETRLGKLAKSSPSIAPHYIRLGAGVMGFYDYELKPRADGYFDDNREDNSGNNADDWKNR